MNGAKFIIHQLVFGQCFLAAIQQNYIVNTFAALILPFAQENIWLGFFQKKPKQNNRNVVFYCQNKIALGKTNFNLFLLLNHFDPNPVSVKGSESSQNQKHPSIAIINLYA